MPGLLAAPGGGMSRQASTQEIRQRIEHAEEKRLLKKLEMLVPHGHKRKVRAALTHAPSVWQALRRTRGHAACHALTPSSVATGLTERRRRARARAQWPHSSRRPERHRSIRQAPPSHRACRRSDGTAQRLAADAPRGRHRYGHVDAGLSVLALPALLRGQPVGIGVGLGYRLADSARCVT